MLPLGEVCPIEMRQLARGYIDKGPLVMIRQIRIVKGYDGIFVLVIVAAFVLAILLFVLALHLLAIF